MNVFKRVIKSGMIGESVILLDLMKENIWMFEIEQRLKFRGSYGKTKVLQNDRYVIDDIEGFRMSSSVLFKDLLEAENTKRWMSDQSEKDDYLGE